MALLDMHSQDCGKSELELFDIPSTQTSIEDSRYEPCYPLTSLDRGGPVELKYRGGDDEYLDLNDTYLYVRARILDEKGEELKATERVGEGAEARDQIPDKSVVFPVNYFLNSCFTQVEVFLNNKTVGSTNTLYPYRAYLETMLTYSPDSKKHQLVASLFHQDQGTMDAVDVEAAEPSNKGAKQRFDRCKFSKHFECVGRLHSEIFHQQKLLLSKVSLLVKLHRADRQFVLMSKLADQKYTISLDVVRLEVSVKKIASHVREAHEARLLTTNAKYPLRKVEMKFYSRGAHMNDLSEPNLVSGILPKRIILGLVSTEAFNGQKKKNPFNFQNYNLNYLAVRKNGQSSPYEPFNLDYGDNQYVMAYFSLLRSTRLMKANHSNAIQPLKGFKDGFALYGFDLTPDNTDGGNLNLLREGTISVDVRLKTPATESITIICYLEYDTIMEIDSNRNIHYE